MMIKTILLVLIGIILLSIIVSRVRRAIRKRKVVVFPVLTVKPLYITPSIEPAIINTSRESLFVREGLDFIKVSKKTLLNDNVIFLRTYSPNEPDAPEKLVVAERLSPKSDTCYNVSSGVTLIYMSGDTYYMAKSAYDFCSERYDTSTKIKLIADDNKLAYTTRYGLVAVVKTIYGDYRIQKADSN